jgi:hypothetical protein
LRIRKNVTNENANLKSSLYSPNHTFFHITVARWPNFRQINSKLAPKIFFGQEKFKGKFSSGRQFFQCFLIIKASKCVNQEQFALEFVVDLPKLFVGGVGNTVAG